MSHEMWIAVGLSIPVGLATGLAGGLLVRPTQRWLDEKGQSRTQRKRASVETEYWDVLYYAGNPTEFTNLLIEGAIRCAFGLTFFTFPTLPVAALVYVTATRPQEPHSSAFAVVTLFTLCCCFGAGYMLSSTFRALKRYKQLASLDKYLGSLPPNIRNATAEAEALWRSNIWPFRTKPHETSATN
jgi:hypothetical protein